MLSFLGGRTWFLSLLLVSAQSVGGYAQVPGFSGPDARIDLQKYRSGVLVTVLGEMSKWDKAWMEKDTRTLADIYTGDATLLLGEDHMLRGRDDIETVLRDILPRAGVMHSWLSEFEVFDATAILVSRFQHVLESGKLIPGSYMAVFRRERRTWKIRYHVFSVDPVPAS